MRSLGLAGVYSDRGDMKGSSALLEKLTQKDPTPRGLVTLASNYEGMKEILAGGGCLQEGDRTGSESRRAKSALWRRIWHSPNDMTKR